MRSEYNCSCHIDGITYSMQTVNCKSPAGAFIQFSVYVTKQGGNWDLLDGLVLDLVEV
jgi:hypothetical protein